MEPLLITLIATVVSAAATVAAVFYTISAAAAWAKVRSAILAQGRADLQQFGQAALALIEDKTVPMSVAAVVEILSHQAGRPTLARSIAFDILSGRLERPSQEPPTEVVREFREDIGRLNAEQRQLLSQCVGHGLMSSAAANHFVALYLRRIIYFGLFETESKMVENAKARAIVVEYSRRGLPKSWFKAFSRA